MPRCQSTTAGVLHSSVLMHIVMVAQYSVNAKSPVVFSDHRLMKCFSAQLGAGGLAAGRCEEPKQSPKQNLKSHAMHKNKGHGTRSRLQGIAVHQQISRTQVGLLCGRRCRVKELLEVAKGSIKALLQPTGHHHFYHEHGSTRTATVSAPRNQTTAPTLALLMFTRPSGSVASNQRLSTPMEKWL